MHTQNPMIINFRNDLTLQNDDFLTCPVDARAGDSMTAGTMC